MANDNTTSLTEFIGTTKALSDSFKIVDAVDELHDRLKGIVEGYNSGT